MQGVLLASIVLCAFTQAAVLVLAPDADRDRAFHLSIQQFIDYKLSSEELEVRVREHLRQFELKPYKVGAAPIEWLKVPEQRLESSRGCSLRLLSRHSGLSFKVNCP